MLRIAWAEDAPLAEDPARVGTRVKPDRAESDH